MKYFSVDFGNFMEFIVKSEKSLSVKDVVFALSNADGLTGNGGAIYNPKQFISVNSISSPDDRQQLRAKDLDKVLF